jgi:hypothetical protein
MTMVSLVHAHECCETCPHMTAPAIIFSMVCTPSWMAVAARYVSVRRRVLLELGQAKA